jgi:hypothetical protein
MSQSSLCGGVFPHESPDGLGFRSKSRFVGICRRFANKAASTV